MEPTCPACGTTLPPDARFCPRCGALVEATPVAGSEERKVATVLFADLVESTALADSQDPERTRATLERFYDAMTAEIEQAGGTIEHFAGDSVMAAFGAPEALEDHAERALHAALGMRRRFDELFGDSLELRIGVNTGEVVVGRPREGSSFVSGDTVNVAKRLEQAAGPGEIFVGERTAAAVRGAFELAEERSVEAKGKPGGVVGRELVRALTLMRPRGVGGLRRAFVGRESELELLQATYRRALDQGEPHVVTIVGDAGVGKTRLVRELWEWLASEPVQPLQRTGRCLSYGQGITYWPLGEVLKEHFGILESDSPRSGLEKLDGREILGLTLGLDVAGDLHPLAARESLHEAWVELLTELATARPLVLLVEDLHWAEEELLELLERLLHEVRAPLLLLATSRPEVLDQRPSWGAGRRNASVVWLEPLSSEQTTLLVDELLAAELPEDLRTVVVERAEGNPFFVEEVIGSLIDQGLLVRSNGAWRAREVRDEVEVPDSVQAVLAARVDLLGPAEKAALQAASVIGRIFWTGPVCELLGGGAAPDFTLLEERDFIRRRPGSSMAGEREYAIKHALTREVAYASVPKAKRLRLHAAFADWIERTSGEEHAALLGHHYAAAVDPEDADLAWQGEEAELERLRGKALFWLERAGDLAVGRYEIDDALALFHRALELGPAEIKESELWRKIGHANALKYDGDAFWSAMQKSLDRCYDPEVCAETYSVLAFETAIRSGMWQRHPEPDLIEGWIDEALERGGPDSASRARALLARCLWAEDAPIEHAQEAGRIAELRGDPKLRTLAWAARALIAFRDGRYKEGFDWAQRQFDIIDQVTDPDALADVHEVLIELCSSVGRFREAEPFVEAHTKLTNRLSSHHRLHGVAIRLEFEEARGDWMRIGELTGRTVDVVQENLATPCVRNMRCLLLSAVAANLGGNDEAGRQLEEDAEALGMEGYDDALRAPRIRLALLRGDLARVEELLREKPARKLWFFLQNTSTQLDALVALGDRERVEEEAPPHLVSSTYLEPFALRALGQVREDEELIRQALERFEAMRLDWHAIETRALVST